MDMVEGGRNERSHTNFYLF